jgi:hypothetical protein
MSRAAVACIVALAGALACKEENPYTNDPVPTDGGGTTFDGSVRDASFEAAEVALTDGRVVSGVRPLLVFYSRDFLTYDYVLNQSIRTFVFVRYDGSIVMQGCSGRATPDELEAFIDVATDLATVDALRNAPRCPGEDNRDMVTVTYDGIPSLTQSALCDPQMKALTAAGTALVTSACARNADAGTD